MDHIPTPTSLGTFPTGLLPAAFHPTHAKGLAENGAKGLAENGAKMGKRGADSTRVAHEPPDGLTPSCSCSLLGAELMEQGTKSFPASFPEPHETKTKGDNTQVLAKATSSGLQRPQNNPEATKRLLAAPEQHKCQKLA